MMPEEAAQSGTAVPHLDIAIIGAGITGLATAYLLHQAGRHVQIFEAADVIGGRIRSFRDPATGEALGDRGPTWVWPEYQPTISQWLSRLELSTFDQFSTGDAIVEVDPGQQPRTMFLPPQHGSVRVEGGTDRLVHELVAALPRDAVQVSKRCLAVTRNSDCIALGFADDSVTADQLVVALPPRVAANTLDWQSALPAELRQALNSMPTWMAPHAKAVVVFDEPFWRNRGLSGRIMSHVGPLMEVHDHCSRDGKVAALFGFVGWPSSVRDQHQDQLPELIVEQLVRCFGQDAAQPRQVFLEDWSRNDLIAQPQDLLGPQTHPVVGPGIVRLPIWNNRIVFAVAETASQSPGLIEGAFVAAEHAARSLLTSGPRMSATDPNPRFGSCP